MGKKSRTSQSPADAGGGFRDSSPFAALAGLAVPAGPAAPLTPVATPPSAGGVGPTVREPARPKSRGRLVLRRETKHRGGKAVIIVSGFGALEDFDPAAVGELARQLKQQLGCGGTVEERGTDSEIVLQGDSAAKVAELLRARGFRVDGVTS